MQAKKIVHINTAGNNKSLLRHRA